METHHGSVSTQHPSDSFHIRNEHGGISSTFHSEMRFHVVSRSEGCLLPDPCPLEIKTFPSKHDEQEPPVQSPVLWSFSAPQVFTGVSVLVLKWSHHRGIQLLQYVDDWLVAESMPLLLGHCHFILQWCQDLRIVINMEKSDLELTQMAQHF